MESVKTKCLNQRKISGEVAPTADSVLGRNGAWQVALGLPVSYLFDCLFCCSLCMGIIAGP